MNKYKLIIFDFDGTLVDSVLSLIIMYRIAFKKLNIPFKDEDAYIYMKESLLHTTQRFNLNPKQTEETFLLFNSLVNTKEVIEANKLFPDTLKMIDFCIKNHYKTAILTSNDSKHVQDVLNALNVPLFYDLAIGCFDVTIPKPDPQGMNLILSKLNISKEDAVYIGDSLHDMQTANNAGVDCVLVDRFNEFKDSNKYKRVNSLNEIKDLF